MLRILKLIGLALMSGTPAAAQASAAHRAELLRAVLATEPVAAKLANRVVVLDSLVREAPADFTGRPLEQFPVAYTLAPASTPRVIGRADAHDTVRITVAQRGAPGAEHATFLIQLREGPTWTSVEIHRIGLTQSGHRWIGRQTWVGEP